MMSMKLLLCVLRLSGPFASAEIVALPHDVVLPARGWRHVRFLGATVLGPPEREAWISLRNVQVGYRYFFPGGINDDDNNNNEQGGAVADDARVAALDDDGWTRRVQRRRRRLQQQQQQHRTAANGLYDDGFDGVELDKDDEGSTPGSMDIAVFRVPSHCAYAPVPADGGTRDDGCRWEDRGVGVSVASYNETNSARANVFWCCSSRAVDAGACSNATQDRNRLILTDSFAGFRRAVNVTFRWGDFTYLGNLIDVDFRLPEPGAWVVLYANCGEDQDGGRQVIAIAGDVEFESDHGYLPGELVPSMRRAVAFAALCSGLLLWFACQMCDNATSTLPVEWWILLAIGVGWIEAWLRTECYLDWNATGVLDSRCPPTTVVLGAAKRAVAQCLVLMVSLGWGVTGDRLHLRCLARCDIALLGAAQFAAGVGFGMSLVDDARQGQPRPFEAAATIAARAAKGLNYDECLISLAILLWTAVALAGTIVTLRSTNQTRKLQRYRSLTAILIGSYLCAAVAVSIAETHVDVDPRYALWVEAASDALYFSLLAGVSYLWRPSDRASEFAYQSPQLPLPPPDDDDLEYELAVVSHTSPPPEEDDDAAPRHSDNAVVQRNDGFECTTEMSRIT